MIGGDVSQPKYKESAKIFSACPIRDVHRMI